MRIPKRLRERAEMGHQLKRMNEQAKVVRNELERTTPNMYGDTSGGYELSQDWPAVDARVSKARPIIGFRA